MKSLCLRSLPFLAFLLFATGCHSGFKLGGVLVTITQYQPTTANSQVALTLRFNNENVFPLAIATTAGKLYLNGTYVGHFEINDPLGVPQLGTISRGAVLLVDNTAYLQALKSSPSDQSIPYRLEILMHLEVSDDKSKINAVFTGQIDHASLLATPIASLKN